MLNSFSEPLSARRWCRRQDLNPQPSAYKAGALPLSYAGPATRSGWEYRPLQSSVRSSLSRFTVC